MSPAPPVRVLGLYRIADRLDGVALALRSIDQVLHIRLGHGPCQSLGQLKQGPDTAVLHANIKLVNDYSLLSLVIAQLADLHYADGRSGSEQVRYIVYADQNGAPGAPSRDESGEDDPPHERVDVDPLFARRST